MNFIDQLAKLAKEIENTPKCTAREVSIANQILELINKDKNQTGVIIVQCPDRFTFYNVFNFIDSNLKGFVDNDTLILNHDKLEILIKNTILSNLHDDLREWFKATPEIIITEI